MDPGSWNNRHISWKFIPTPSYSGDIQVGFLQGAQTWWAAIAVSHLANGIHAVEYYANGAWSSATMNGDMGQAYIIKPLVAAGTDFQIRVRDVTDTLINGGRVYSFSLPASCGAQCSPAYTQVSYTTSDGPTPTPTPTPSVTPTPTAGACAATFEAANSWTGGFQGEVTVKAGTKAINGWTVSWSLASGQSIGSSWNGVFTTSGSTVIVKNAAYNGALAASASTSFGFVGSGTAATPTVTCTSP